MRAAMLDAWWWRYARVPLVLGVAIVAAMQLADLDTAWARLLFYDTAHHDWRGAHNWWTEDLAHELGGRMVRALGAAALLATIVSFSVRRYRAHRRAAFYLFLAVGSTAALVGVLKASTGIDCPWDLAMYGGAQPYVRLFDDRSVLSTHGACFPAAHAASGYAWMSLYFLACERSKTWARRGLLFGLSVGLVFGFAQQSRGAHFLSHDVVSAVLAWLASLTLYVYGFRLRLWESSHHANAGLATDPAVPTRRTDASADSSASLAT